MSHRLATGLAWGLCVLTALVLAATAAFGVANGSASVGDSPGTGAAVAYVVIPLAFAIAGAVIAAHQPRNPIGWIFCGSSLALAVSSLGEEYAGYVLFAEPGVLPGGETMTWLAAWIFSPGLLPLVTFFLLLFPDGRLPSRRWRPMAWLATAATVALAVGYAFTPGRFEDYPRVENPFGFGGVAGELASAAEGIGWVLLPFAVLGCAIGLIVRFRRSRGEERLQMKWVVAAGAVSATCLALQVVLWFAGFPEVAEALILFGLLLIPVASGVAILRYRLYDIDVVVRRTVVFGALTAALAGAYVGSVLLLQLLLSPDSDLAIAGSTLAVAALFRPLRTRIQTLVDRRFFRSRYDAARTLESFGARLRNEVDLDALEEELRRVAADSVQPAHLSLWLRTPR
jgi:hypothetical protein